MDILEFIKKRATIRKYKSTKITIHEIEKILEAGIWSSSVHGFQPWEFIVVTNRNMVKRISSIIFRKSLKIGERIDRILRLTADTIANSPALILVYNQGIFRAVSNRLFKINKSFIKIAEATELQSISAAIQNMILTAQSQGIGSCWNSTPLFCEKEINKLLKHHGSLVAILSLGYPDEKSKRTVRKSVNEKIKFIK